MHMEMLFGIAYHIENQFIFYLVICMFVLSLFVPFSALTNVTELIIQLLIQFCHIGVLI